MKKNILVVDDTALMRRVECDIINSDNNFQVADICRDGVEAYEKIKANSYDGVILDIMMPGLDGISVLKKVRAAGNSVPILLLTAKGEIDDRVLGLDSGADDYLPKPFSTKELLARVRAMTRRKADITADNLLSAGDITLDRLKFELSCNGNTTGLSGKEFQMLEMLMLSPEQVISTELFMEKIWGLDSDAELNVVWVYISNLRKKLKSIGSNVQIKAARSLGYCLLT